MDATALLETLAAWHPRLAAVTDAEAETEVGSRWNRKELVGHLLDSAMNNYQRFVRLRQGDLRGFPGYEADPWVEAGAYRHGDWNQLVALWHRFNLQLATVIHALPGSAAGHRWVDQDVDLDYLVRDYTAHLLHHLERLKIG
jgi:hypothetical protein